MPERAIAHRKEIADHCLFDLLEFYLVLTPVQWTHETPRTPEDRRRIGEYESKSGADFVPVSSWYNHHANVAWQYEAADRPWGSWPSEPSPPPRPSEGFQRSLRERYLKPLGMAEREGDGEPAPPARSPGGFAARFGRGPS